MTRRNAVLVTLGVFCIAFAAYALSPVKTSYDSRWVLHTAMSIAHGKGGDLSDYNDTLDRSKFYATRHMGGRPYNLFPVGPPLLVMPAVIVWDRIDPSFSSRLHNGGWEGPEKFLASVIGAAAVAVFFWLIFGQFGHLYVAAGSAFIFAFCTSMWSTATRALWQHGPLVLMLLIAMLLLQRAQRRPALIQYVSLPLAFAFITRPTAAIPVAFISAYVAIYFRKWIVKYLAWSALIAIPWLAYNYSIYQSLFPDYFNTYAGERDFWQGLLGNLVSPSRGLLIFSPILILSISGFVLAMRERESRPLYLAYGAIVVLMIMVMAGAPMWWGGHSYGPRFTTDILPFVAFFMSFTLMYFSGLGHRARNAFLGITVVLVLVSFAMHYRGATSSSALDWNVIPNNVDSNLHRFWDWRDPQFLRNVLR